MRYTTPLKSFLFAGLALASLNSQAVTWPETPLGIVATTPPMTLIVAGRDHKLYYEAYNDASDIDGDGMLDVNFKPNIVYYGLFDATLCYEYASNKYNPI